MSTTLNKLIDLLLWAKKDGVDFVLAHEQLQVKVPKNKTIDPHLLEAIRNNKEQIIDFLKSEELKEPGKELLGLCAFDRKEMDQIPLSFAQERLWFIDQFNGSVQYHMPWVFRISGRLNTAALNAAFKAIMERHEILRTVIGSEEGTGFQKVMPFAEWQLTQQRVEDSWESDSIPALVKSLINHPFDLSSDPMLRVTLLTNNKKEYMLVVVLHHIAFDGWSIGVMVNELAVFYNSFITESAPQLIHLPVQYADYAVWQRNFLSGSFFANKLAYWKQQLTGVTVLDLLTDYARPAEQGISGAVAERTLNNKIKDHLLDFAHGQQATSFMVLLTVFKMLLHRYTGQQDICIGTPIAGRDSAAIENLLGFFVNTLAVRTEVRNDSSFVSLLDQVKKGLLEAFKHKDVPFEKVVEALGVERDMGRNPVFQVMFSMHTETSSEAPLFSGITLTPENNSPVFAKVDLHLNIVLGNRGLVLSIVYRSDLYSSDTVERMLEHYAELLDASLNNSLDAIETLNMISADERQNLLEKNNETHVDFPVYTLPALVQIQASQSPGSVAMVSGTQRLSYELLDQQSNQFSHYLQAEGISKGSLVAVCMDRSIDLAVVLLGILKTGAAYVPIDPAYPVFRISYMMSDTRAGVAVTSKVYCHLFDGNMVKVICLDEEQDNISRQDSKKPGYSPEQDDLAYVIYTSGSTGTPKGVMITHASVINLVQWHIREFEVTNYSRATAMAGIGFDAFGWEIWPYLCAGASVYMFTEDERFSMERITAIFQEEKITHSFVATALAITFINESAGKDMALRYLLTGGDRLPPVYTKNAGYHIVNNYGPTENTVVATSYTIPKTGGHAAPLIGKPVSNVHTYILDKTLRLAPQGVAGELYVGGLQLARGYLNLPALTDEKFIRHPFGKNGKKLYRTGDKARWLSDGNLEFLGRTDDQIKLRGYRIEPGEIEAVLQKAPGVKQVIVLLHKQEHHAGHLVAFIVAGEGWSKELTLAYARKQIPEYMVPSVLEAVKEIPLTANGKANRQQLLQNIVLPGDIAMFVPPQTDQEIAVARIWNELLGREKTGIHENFFEIGGHSLLAMRLVSALRKATGKELTVRKIFEYPTINSLVSWLSESYISRTLPPIEKFSGTARIPLSFEQERLWFIDRLHGSLQYHIPWVLRLNGNLDVDLLENTLRSLVNRHEILRTVIKEDNGIGYQQLISAADWYMNSFTPEAVLQQNDSIHQFQEQFILQPFNLSSGYPLKVLLIRLSEQEYLLTGVVHHIAFDGWSTGIFVEDLTVMYTAAKKGISPALKELRFQYSDYAIWQRKYLSGDAFEEKISYWKEQLKDVAPLGLTTDFPRPAYPSTRGDIVSDFLERNQLDKLLKFSHEQGTTLFMTLLAAFKTLLYRYTGNTDICVGTPVAGRQQQELEGVIGFFLNTLAIRSEIDPGMSFTGFLQQVRQTTLTAYDYQDVPFEKIVEVLGTDRDRSRNTLFQVWIVLQNMPGSEPLDLGGVSLKAESPGVFTSQFDLNLDIAESAEGLQLSLTYCSDLYHSDTALRILNHYKQILISILSDCDVTVSALQMIPPQELEIIVNFGTQGYKEPLALTINDLFNRQVSAVPSAAALQFGDVQLSYLELNKRACQLAEYLTKHGVKPGDSVGLCTERSFEMIIGIMGILKAGAAYVPLDPSYPADRLEYMIADSSCLLVLTTGQTEHPLSGNIPLVYLDNIQDNGVPEKNLSSSATPSHLAYIIYTSGSSGRPKGVMIAHTSVVNLIDSQQKTFGICAGEKILQFSNYCFDASVEQIFLALLTGSTLVIIPKRLLLDIPAFEAMLSAQMINHLHATPGFLELITPRNYTALKRVIAGGESCPASLAKKWHGFADFYNEYGPTEATVTAIEMLSTNAITSNDTLPIGKPLDHVLVYLLEATGYPSGIGVPAEIYIGGIQVAKGYRNLPDRTAEGFLQIPGAGRVYRTGDKGRWLANGNIEFMGRVDDQVKIRGYRIEPAEVETVLQQAPGISRAVVLLHEDGQDKRLIGYIVAENSFDREEVLGFVKARLPEYMVPSMLVQVDEIPLTGNGKVDKKKLSKIFLLPALTKGYEGPRNSAEEILAAIWQELLEVEKIGIRDNFFELGGHSLLAVRVIAAIRNRMGIELPVVVLFEYPTIAMLSLQLPVKAEQALLPVISRYTGSEKIPLSFAQERLWFIDRLQGSIQYHMPWVFRLKGNLHTDVLEASFREIVDRHEVLRTVIREEEGTPYQLVMPASNWNMRYISIEELAATGLGEKQYINEQLLLPAFDLSRDAMLNVSLIRHSEQESTLVILLHHIAFDGWSIAVMVKELAALYNNRLTNASFLLNELPVQYKDYAVWQRNYLSGKVLATKLDFWKNRLDGITPLDLPLDYPRPPVQSTRGNTLTFTVSKEITNSLNALSQQRGATLFMTLSAIFKILLFRYTGQDDIAIGTPVANRSQEATDTLIGFFVNTIVLRDDLGGDPSFISLLEKVKATALEAYAHQDTPFEKIVEEVAAERSMSYTPLFQVLFALQNTPRVAELELSCVSLLQEYIVNGTSRFDLYFDLLETMDGLQVQIEYCTDLFQSATITRMFGHYLSLICAVTAGPSQTISSLGMISKNELIQLQQFNNTTTHFEQAKTITGMFEEQVEASPLASAVFFEETTINYTVLNERANRLAHYLILNGSGEGELVMVCLERSIDMIITVLAVLKAGAAYIPIDPQYPRERIEFMLRDANASVIVTSEPCSGLVSSIPERKVVLIDRDSDAISRCSPHNTCIQTKSGSLGYVIYTSGSTGVPKGVQLTCDGLTNLLLWQREQNVEGKLRILQFASLNFDVSFQEIFTALCFGNSLYLIGEDQRKNMQDLMTEINIREITSLFIPYVVLKGLADYAAESGIYPFSLREIFTAGEQLKLTEEIRLLAEKTGLRLLNQYGPSEAHVVSSYEVRAEDYDKRILPPIGRPIANTQLYILGKNGAQSGIGIAGELYIGGVQVARGYLNRPELTETKFTEDCFSNKKGARLYHTGDKARWLPDGNIEFLGRLDDQVKINGYRIELGEVEAALQKAPGIRQAVVISKEDSVGSRRLVGYVVPDGIFEREALLAYLRQSLPGYMIPAFLIALETIPVTPNGKTDKKRLPEVDVSLISHRYEAPRTTTEEKIVTIWEQLLGVKPVSIYDHFFEIGGHSLLVTRMAAVIRKEFKMEISVRIFFQLTTPEQIAAYIDVNQLQASYDAENYEAIEL